MFRRSGLMFRHSGPLFRLGTDVSTLGGLMFRALGTQLLTFGTDVFTLETDVPTFAIPVSTFARSVVRARLVLLYARDAFSDARDRCCKVRVICFDDARRLHSIPRLSASRMVKSARAPHFGARLNAVPRPLHRRDRLGKATDVRLRRKCGTRLSPTHATDVAKCGSSASTRDVCIRSRVECFENGQVCRVPHFGPRPTCALDRRDRLGKARHT